MTKNIKAFRLLLAVLTISAGIDHPAFAENHPPTDGAMTDFILLKPRIKAPETPFFDETGRHVQISAFTGQVILLNFWASWCAPCLHEMPSLDRLEASLGGKDFMVLAINQDFKGLKKARATMRDKLKLDNLRLFTDPRLNLTRDYKVRGLPASYIIDKRGNIAGIYNGPTEWDSEDAKKLIRHMIAE